MKVHSYKHVLVCALLAVLVVALSACGQEPSTATPVPPTAAPTAPTTAPPTQPARPTLPATPPLPATTVGRAAESPTAATVQAKDHASDAQRFVSWLAQGNYASAEATFDDTMQQVMPLDKLQQTWEALIAQVGQFKEQLGTRTTQTVQNGVQYQVVLVTCAFANSNIDVRVVYGPDGKVAGLFFAQAQGSGSRPTPTFDPPRVDTSTFTEKEVTVGSGQWALTGTLTVPKGSGPFPGVVLVHGSGPSDQDETVGSNKPFRDIAWGLASQGVAVLRYDKRTHAYPLQMAQLKNITVKEETVDDAAAAVSLLAATDKVDPMRVLVLGHSLGGYLLPKIAQAAPQAAGLVSLAGATRPLEDLVVDQDTYIFSLDGKLSPDEQKELDAVKAQAARIKEPNLSPDTPASELLAAPGSYWLDLRGYNPAQMASTLGQPMLILQGENDYQVATKDFQGWKDALSSRSNATFKSYPGLNHLFIAIEGKSTPQNTLLPGHVSPEVIEDIADWIKQG